MSEKTETSWKNYLTDKEREAIQTVGTLLPKELGGLPLLNTLALIGALAQATGQAREELAILGEMEGIDKRRED